MTKSPQVKTMEKVNKSLTLAVFRPILLYVREKDMC